MEASRTAESLVHVASTRSTPARAWGASCTAWRLATHAWLAVAVAVAAPRPWQPVWVPAVDDPRAPVSPMVAVTLWLVLQLGPRLLGGTLLGRWRTSTSTRAAPTPLPVGRWLLVGFPFPHAGVDIGAPYPPLVDASYAPTRIRYLHTPTWAAFASAALQSLLPSGVFFPDAVSTSGARAHGDAVATPYPMPELAASARLGSAWQRDVLFIPLSHTRWARAFRSDPSRRPYTWRHASDAPPEDLLCFFGQSHVAGPVQRLAVGLACFGAYAAVAWATRGWVVAADVADVALRVAQPRVLSWLDADDAATDGGSRRARHG